MYLFSLKKMLLNYAWLFVILDEDKKRGDKFMKKKVLIIIGIILAIAVLGLGIFFAVKNHNYNNVEGSLEELMTKLHEGIGELPKLNNTPITDENLSYFLGVDKLEYEEALASEPFMGSYAHSVVLVRVKAGQDINKIKKDIKAKVDPRKWICVGVEDKNVLVENRGNLIVLIMSNKSKKIKENFVNL